MISRRLLLVATGEGVLAGSVAGFVLAGWEIGLNGFVRSGLLFLSALLVVSSVARGAIVGLVVSLILAASLAMARRRGPRAVWIAIASLGLLATGLVASTLLLRPEVVFPPWRPGSRGLLFRSALAVSSVVPVALTLFALRAMDGLRERPRGAQSGSRARNIVAWTGVALMPVLLAAQRVVLPDLAARRSAGHPSVILISIDTLRADRLGTLGYPRNSTPFLDRLAREGVLFTNAAAAAPWTMPSHASVFTSMLPFDHRGQWYREPLLPRRSMLAERFREAGYRTAAFTGGVWVDGDRGFYQGFELYANHDELKSGGPEAYFSRAARWVRERDGAPYFLFLHTYEPHTPYVHSRFADPADAGRLGESFDYDELGKIRSGELVLTDQERRFVSDLYDGDIAEADRLVKGFFDQLAGRLDDVIVVVLSDHGEELWEHYVIRSPDHGHSLYQELLHVPLICWAPGRVRSGARIETPVSLIDVAPTVLALAGLPRDPQHRGAELVETLRTGAEPAARPIYAESLEYGPDRFSVRDGDTKIIVTPIADRVHNDVHLPVEPLEVFDLATDPHELHNAVGLERPEILEALYSRAARKLRGTGDVDDLTGIPEELRDRLRALGYVR